MNMSWFFLLLASMVQIKHKAKKSKNCNQKGNEYSDDESIDWDAIMAEVSDSSQSKEEEPTASRQKKSQKAECPLSVKRKEDSNLLKEKAPAEKKKLQKIGSFSSGKRKRDTKSFEKGEQSGARSPDIQEQSPKTTALTVEGNISLTSIHLEQQRLFRRFDQVIRELEVSSEAQDKMMKKINSIHQLLRMIIGKDECPRSDESSSDE